ncbi:MAG: hypothetical protein PHF51_00990, partial [Candidatus ainarchaeum sp.]|nr:hypothetical protein [Candidatus ainarchaeum sp.]
MLDIGNMTVCFPFFLLLAFLFAALYAQGKSPLGFFDITSPQKQTARQPGVRSYQFMSGAASLQRNALALLKGGVISGLAHKVGLQTSKYNSIQFAGQQLRHVNRGRHAGEIQIKRGSRWETLRDADGKVLKLDQKLGSALSTEALQNALVIRAYADGKTAGKDGALLPLPGLGRVKNAELQAGLSEIFGKARVAVREDTGKITPKPLDLGKVNLTNMVLTRSAIGGGRLGQYQRAAAGDITKLEKIYSFPADAILAKRINLREGKGILSRGYYRYKTFALTEKTRAAKVNAYDTKSNELNKHKLLREGVQRDQTLMQGSLFYGELQWAATTSLITTTIPVFGGMLKQYKYAGVMAAATGRTVVNAHAIGRQMKDWRKNPEEYKKYLERTRPALEQRMAEQKGRKDALEAEIAKLERMLESGSMVDPQTGAKSPYKNAKELKAVISIMRNNLGSEAKSLESLERQLASAYARVESPPPQFTLGQSLKMLGEFYADYYLGDPVSRLMKNRAESNRLKANRLLQEAEKDREVAARLAANGEELNELKGTLASAITGMRKGGLGGGRLYATKKRLDGRVTLLDGKLAAIEATIAAADIKEKLDGLTLTGKGEGKEAQGLRQALGDAIAAKNSLDAKVLDALNREDRKSLEDLKEKLKSASGGELVRLEAKIRAMNAKIGIFRLEDVPPKAQRALAEGRPSEKAPITILQETLWREKNGLGDFKRVVEAAAKGQETVFALNAELAALVESGKKPRSPEVRELRRKIAVGREALEMHAQELERGMVWLDGHRRRIDTIMGGLKADLEDAEKNAAKFQRIWADYDLGKKQRQLLHEKDGYLLKKSDVDKKIKALEEQIRIARSDSEQQTSTSKTSEAQTQLDKLKAEQTKLQSSIKDKDRRIADAQVEHGFRRWLRASAGARQYAREMAQERFSSAHGTAPAKIGELDMFLAGMAARPLFGLLPPVVRMDVNEEGKYYIGRGHEEWLSKNEA